MLPGKKQGVAGFTLIELLIVVAIVAILAAIAVPNFLDAQTRAKVSRVKVDLRNLATAVESYAVTENVPPLGFWARSYRRGSTSTINFGKLDPIVSDAHHPLCILTTPIGYISRLPKDIFSSMSGVASYDQTNGQIDFKAGYASLDRAGNFWYESSAPVLDWNFTTDNTYGSVCRRASLYDMHVHGYKWVLASPGPCLKQMDYNYLLDGNVPWQVGCYAYSLNMPYDPTNGTRSLGHIIRTNKGGVVSEGWFDATKWGDDDKAFKSGYISTMGGYYIKREMDDGWR